MTSKTDKLRAVFLTALMIGSVFAAGVAFTGGAAAAVTNAGTASDVGVGADSTSQAVSTVTVDTGGDVNISIDSLVDAGVDIGSASASATATDAGSASVSNFNTDTNNITVAVTTGGSTAGDAAFDLTISGVNTSGVSTSTGLTYSVTDVSAGDSSDTSSFDLVSQSLNSMNTQVQSDDRTVEGDQGTFQQSIDANITVADGASGEEVTVDLSEAVADAGLEATNAAIEGTDASVAASSATVEDDGETITFDVSDDTNDGSPTTGVVTLRADLNTTDISTDNRLSHTVSAFGDSVDVDFKTFNRGVTITQTDANTEVFSGETVTFEDATGAVTGVEVWSTDSDGNADSRQANLNTSPGSAINYDSGNLDQGDYIVRFDNGTQTDVNLTVSDLDLTAELQSDSVTNTGSIDIDTTSADPLGDYTAYVYAAGADLSSDDPLATQSGSFDGSGESTESFTIDDYSDIEAGSNYTVVVEHDDSGVTAQTAEVAVSDAADASADFESVEGAAVGDIATVNVSLTNTDTATVNIGSADVGYQANVTVVDDNGDGYVELSINTYTMGNQTDTDAFVAGNAFYVAGDSDDYVDSVSQRTGSSLTEPIDDGRYRTTVRQGSTASDTPNSITRLQLTAPSGVTAQNVWTAPGATELGDFPSDATLSQDDSIANGDYVVHEISADGVFGILQNTSAANDTAALATAIQQHELDLTVEQTSASTQTNRDPKTVNYINTLENGNGTVVANSTSGTIYVAVDLANADSSRSINFGNDVFNASVGLNATTTSLISEGGDASAEFSAAELDEELSQNTYEVTNAVNQTITGTSTAADGTEYNIYVESDETQGDGFIEPENTATVEDGEISADVDFDEASVNDTFTVLLEDPNGEQIDSATGTVVADTGGEDETTTEAPDTTTEAPDTTTEAPDTTTEAPDTTTEAPDTTTEAPADTTTEEGGDGGSDGGSIPGFGVGIALVAILGAALLALRE